MFSRISRIITDKINLVEGSRRSVNNVARWKGFQVMEELVVEHSSEGRLSSFHPQLFELHQIDGGSSVLNAR